MIKAEQLGENSGTLMDIAGCPGYFWWERGAGFWLQWKSPLFPRPGPKGKIASHHLLGTCIFIILDKNQALSHSSTSYADWCGHFEMKVTFSPFLMEMKRLTLAQKGASVPFWDIWSSEPSELYQCPWKILNMHQFQSYHKTASSAAEQKEKKPKLA